MLRRIVFWGGAAALAWTHVGYPLAAAAAARLRPRPVRREDGEPSVSLNVAAHDEAYVIERRVENLLQLDYPAEKLEVVVASDASEDGTDALVEEVSARDARVRLIKAPRGGKVAAQNLAVRETAGEIVAFSDANATWPPDALRKLVRSFADPDVAYVTGRATYADADGTSRLQSRSRTHIRPLQPDTRVSTAVCRAPAEGIGVIGSSDPSSASLLSP